MDIRDVIIKAPTVFAEIATVRAVIKVNKMLRDLEKSEFTYNPHRGINIDINGLEDKKIYQLLL